MSSKFQQLSQKMEDELMSRNSHISEFILILTMWAKEKQSEIQMVKEMSTCKGKFQELPSLVRRGFFFLKFNNASEPGLQSK